jgi:hypothetical protein
MCISMLCVVCCVEKEAIPMSKPQHTTDKTYGTGARCTPHYFAHTIILRTPLFRPHHYFAHPIILRTPLFCTHHYFAHTIILHLQQTDVQTWHQLHIWTSLAHHPFQHNDCSTSLQCNSFPLRRTYVSGCPIINIYYTPANKDNTKKTENFPGKFRTL